MIPVLWDSPVGAVVTGVATATTFSGALTGNVTGNVQGDVTGDEFGGVTGDVTGNVTGNINSASASGISTVGILTAYSSVTIGSTNVLTAIDGKTSPGKSLHRFVYGLRLINKQKRYCK